MHDVAAADRGVQDGDATTVLLTTEVQGSTEETNVEDVETSRDIEDGEAELTELQRTMRDTTIGVPDAEGTRLHLAMEDSEMMDVDEASED